MALQSQTHANSGNAYYITNYAPSFNPSTNVSLRSPVEIIFTSSIQGQFYGYLDQTPSTFTISENNANLSTVNSLVFDPVAPKTTMNVYDLNNAIAEPVIQQWSHTSSIVNGIFKVGNKQLNDEPTALNMSNSNNHTYLTQGVLGTTIDIDGVSQRVIFSEFVGDSTYTAIGTGSVTNPTGTVRVANDTTGNNIIMDPTQVSFNGSGGVIPYGRTGVGNIAPNTYYMTARTGIDFVTDDVNQVLTPLSLKQDGTATMISTLNVPALKQGNIVQNIDGANTRTRFNNSTDGGFSYTEINQIASAPSVIVLNTQAQTKITPSTIAISNFLASPSQVAKIGTIPSFPNTFMLESYHDTQIRTNINGYSTATFKENGTTELLSTLIVPALKQGNAVQTLDGTNTRTRFLNTADVTIACVEINQIPSAPSLIVVNANTQMKMTPSTIEITNFAAGPQQVGKIGTIPSLPMIFMLESYHDTQIRTNISNYSTATFKEDGTTELLSTLKVPYISTTNLLANTISSVNIDANDISCIKLLATDISTTNISSVNVRANSLLATNISSVSTRTGTLFGTNTQALNISTTNVNATNLSTTNLLATSISSMNISTTNLLATSISTNNIALNTINSVPYSPFYTGMIMPYTGDVGAMLALTGWLYCNGFPYDGTNPLYSALFAVIGLNYGGSGTTFNLPDLRSRTIFGSMDGAYTPSQFTFQIYATGWGAIPVTFPALSVAPGFLPNNQCAIVNIIESGFELAVGMTLKTANPALDPNTYTITEIINYSGGSGTYTTNETYPVIILNTPTIFNLNNTDCIITNVNNYLQMGSQTRNNTITQETLQVAAHQHSAFTTQSLVANQVLTSGLANAPSPVNNVSTGFTAPNLSYILPAPTFPYLNNYGSQKPSVMPIIPSIVAMNFIIKL